MKNVQFMLNCCKLGSSLINSPSRVYINIFSMPLLFAGKT